MANSKNKSDRLKLLLVPILVLVLLAVFPAGDDNESDAGQVELAARPIAAIKKKPSTRVLADWPHHSLKSVLNHNPFVLKDPRAEFDRAMVEHGIADSTDMMEVSPADFMASDEEPASDNVLDEEKAFLAELMAAPVESDERTDDRSEEETNPPAPAPETGVSSGAPNTAVAESGMTAEEQHAELMRRRRVLLNLQTQTVTMFMQSRAGNSVLVGDRRVTEGEEIEKGVRVATIDKTGVTFEVLDVTQTDQTTKN